MESDEQDSESDEEDSSSADPTSEAGPTEEEEQKDISPQETDSGGSEVPSPVKITPAYFDGPVQKLVHRSLTSAWRINDKLPMCFAFDSISPARRFKRDMPFSSKADFPILGEEEEPGNVTETDVDGPGLMPYAHNPYRYAAIAAILYGTLTPWARTRFAFRYALAADSFMNWRAGELRTVELGQWRKRRGVASQEIYFTSYQIPAPYDRLVSQLTAEQVHADSHDSHESRRRGVYALQTLDAFGEELKEFGNVRRLPATFRSKVLTPILQRHRLGIHDAYTPFVHTCIAGKGRSPLVEDVTRVYLGKDPANPAYIRQYRRQLLYLPDPRWHLAVIMGVSGKTQEERDNHYNRVRANHDRIMKIPLAEAHAERDPHGVPLLTCTEIEVILDERLEDFFTEELKSVVSGTCSRSMPLPHQPTT